VSALLRRNNQVSPTAPSAPARTAGSGAPAPRWRSLITVGAVLVTLALGVRLDGAWQQTARREAYLPQLEEQARHTPNDASLLALLGGRLAQAEAPRDRSQATKILAGALAGGQQEDVVWLALARTDARLGNPAAALSVLQKGRESIGGPRFDSAAARVQALGPDASPSALAAAISPDGVEPLIAHYAAGGLGNALASWWGRLRPEASGFMTRQEWALREPQNAQALRLWGQALAENRRPTEAVRVLTQASTLAPADVATHLALAEALERVEANDYARIAYLKALGLQKDLLPALLGFGRTCAASGLRYARPAFQRATQIAPNSAEAWIGLGHAETGRFEYQNECLHAFETAVRLAPDQTDFYDDYAQALGHADRQEEAERILRQRLVQQPEDAAAHYLLSTALRKQSPTPDRLAQAEQSAREAVRLSPTTAEFQRQLGDVLLNAGKIAAAIAALEAAIAADPYEVQARRLLARAYTMTGRPELAAQTAARAAALFQDKQQLDTLVNQSERRYQDPAYHRQQIELYERTGQTVEARQERQTLALLQKDPAGTEKSYKELQESIRAALGANAL